jgi:hypothetical protein
MPAIDVPPCRREWLRIRVVVDTSRIATTADHLPLASGRTARMGFGGGISSCLADARFTRYHRTFSRFVVVMESRSKWPSASGPRVEAPISHAAAAKHAS